MRNPLTVLARLSLGGLGGAIVGGLAGLGLVVAGVATCAWATAGGASDEQLAYAIIAAMVGVGVGAIAGAVAGSVLATRRRRAAEAKPAPPAPQPPLPNPPAQ